jgi:DNA polymerase I-like protein with 3'-5' exonuclease and polymerase domains
MMTYKLYEYQKSIMLDPSMERVYWVFQNIEMPIVVVTANMELRVVKVDTDFGEKLKLKYNRQLNAIDEEITNTLSSYQDIIKAWRENDENKKPARVYTPKKSKKSLAQLEEEFPCVDNDKDSPNFGKRYKLGKSRAEQLADPINLASPVQLAILFYDVLGAPQVSKKSPRGTGEDELKAILEKMPELKLCDLILKRRGIVKLITTYIDVIPDLVKHWPDGRIRFHLNSMGTDTGRYSSGGKLKFFEDGEPIEVSGINVQNIPSHNKEIRLLFQGDTKYHERDSLENWFEVPEVDEVETPEGWKFVSDLSVGDIVIIDENSTAPIQNIEKQGKIYRIKF